MLLYDVLYYRTTTGKLVPDCDSATPWHAIAAPPRGQVAHYQCVNGDPRNAGWIDHTKVAIPTPDFAR